MCTNKRYITTLRGKRLLVNCGHCPACLQEKANSRANRIRLNSQDDKVCLFFGLTYDNKHVPYFRLSEFLHADVYETGEHDENHFEPNTKVKDITIYRDFDRCYKRAKGKVYNVKSSRVERSEPLSVVTIPHFKEDKHFKHLANYDSDKIGVCYYPDFQNFIKRLRINLKRKYNVSQRFKFYACSEYGPDTCRPHFHVLAFVPKGCVSIFRRAINESWPYDNCNLIRKQIQIARDAASYVASYVNCTSFLCRTLAQSAFRPKYSFSHGFGFGTPLFSFENVCKQIYARNLRFNRATSREKPMPLDSFLFPKYVFNRYFPKIKGYCNLTSNEVINIYTRPSKLANYYEKLGFKRGDLHKYETLLRNKIKLAAAYGISSDEYGFLASLCYRVSSSNLLESFYKSQNDRYDIHFSYDNIGELYSLEVNSPSLSLLLKHPASDIIDPNEFPYNKQKTLDLIDEFYSRSKDMKFNNKIYSQFSNF